MDVLKGDLTVSSCASPPRLRGFACLITGLALLVPPLSNIAAGAQRDDRAAPEYAVKVAVLFKLALFVEWPESGAAGQDAFVIGILGNDPFGSLLEEVVAGEQVSGRPFRIQRSDDLEPLLASQILFISSSEEHRLEEVLAASHRRSILTVGDVRGFCERGGMVNLILHENRVLIELNRPAAGEAALRFDSKLLQIARQVETRSLGAVEG